MATRGPRVEDMERGEMGPERPRGGTEAVHPLERKWGLSGRREAQRPSTHQRGNGPRGGGRGAARPEGRN